MENHSRDKQELLNSLGVDPSKGLSAAEAQKRLAEVGENKLAEKKKKSLFVRFLEQFKDVMIIILIVAAIISLVVACFGEDPMEFIEPALIFFIVIMNAVIGVLQENKAEKALEALKNMSAPHARVLRDGKEKFIQASALVPGDIIKLEAGDFVPADARLVDSANLKSEESALTGESVPSEKDSDAVVEDKAPIGDRRNMVFSGCSITYGRATAVVTGTGMKTEMGKIADLLAGEKEEATPLQQKLAKLGKWLGIVALAACAIVFVVGLIDSIQPLEIFMVAVSLAVSAIPEGLPAIITIVLSIGVTRMVKKNAIIKRLPAVETLGSASVICSDKTGTLTQNRMTLVKTYVDGGAVADLDVDLVVCHAAILGALHVVERDTEIGIVVNERRDAAVPAGVNVLRVRLVIRSRERVERSWMPVPHAKECERVSVRPRDYRTHMVLVGVVCLMVGSLERRVPAWIACLHHIPDTALVMPKEQAPRLGGEPRLCFAVDLDERAVRKDHLRTLRVRRRLSRVLAGIDVARGGERGTHPSPAPAALVLRCAAVALPKICERRNCKFRYQQIGSARKVSFEQCVKIPQCQIRVSRAVRFDEGRAEVGSSRKLLDGRHDEVDLHAWRPVF